jgi:hypothetical protein
MQETPKAADAYRRYVALGPTRSLEQLARAICREYPERRPATVLVVLKRWSAAHDWQGRLGGLVQATVADAEFAERERIRQILTSGYALQHERVARLGQIAELLYGDLTGGKLWLDDFKSAGKVLMPIERPNAAWVSQFRGLLDDIAAEVGQRRPPKEEHGSDGSVSLADQQRAALLTDDERTRLVAGFVDTGRARATGPAAQAPDPPA